MVKCKPIKGRISAQQPTPVTKSKKKSKIKEYMEIGGSPIPGITLQRTLRGHKGHINRISWSPNGHFLASSSSDGTVRIWDAKQGACLDVIDCPQVKCLAWSPDNHWLVFSGIPGTIYLWDVENHMIKGRYKSPHGDVWALAWSSNGSKLASGDSHGVICIWNTEKWDVRYKYTQEYHQFEYTFFDNDNSLDTDSVKLKETYFNGITVENAELNPKRYWILSFFWLPNSDMLAFGALNSNIFRIWDIKHGSTNAVELPSSGIYDIIQSPLDNVTAIANGTTIRILNTQSPLFLRESESHYETRILKSTLEGHIGSIRSLSFSSDGKILASKSIDGTIRFWKNGAWQEIGEFIEISHSDFITGIAFHPDMPILATLGNEDTIIRVWEVNIDRMLGRQKDFESMRYTTAKLALVGDSMVGKTALGWRLAHNEFRIYPSTHGQQFWVVKDLCTKRQDGTECEAVLWDLAGQHIYRPIHTIFLDNVNLALVLFDPTNRQDTLKGVEFWLGQLAGKNNLPPSVLIGTKVDRGEPVLSRQELNQFCQCHGISGGYISTSAMTGQGINDLLSILKEQIQWEQMTTTITTITFKRIKEYVLMLKGNTHQKGIVIQPSELRLQLEAIDRNLHFTDAEMMTAVGHLENHGYVTLLRNSAGTEYILLAPDLLVGLASSIILLADKNPRELGAISETELLQGKYKFDELVGLAEYEQQILLDAAIFRFLKHNICFRETYGSDTLLIFPGLIKQKRPLKDDIPSTDDISYIVHGKIENIYAMLVVLLGYTPSFTRINQWQNQAQYETKEGKICGFRMIEEREGEIEFILYYGNDLSMEEFYTFQELFERFLYLRDVKVSRLPPVICPQGHRQERATVIKCRRESKTFIFCYECGEKANLPNMDEPQTIGISVSHWLQKEEAMARLRSAYETKLSSVKGYRRGWAAPRCYISAIPEQAKLAMKLAHDLNDAGVYIIGKAEEVQENDFIIILDTQDYQEAWRLRAESLDEDMKLINARLAVGKPNLISIIYGDEKSAYIPHDIYNCKPGNFYDETHYPVSLFDLVLNLYAVPLDHAGFAPLRQSLHQQWDYLAVKMKDAIRLPLKVFISYSHKDEEFKDELVTMLAGLQRNGVIDAWQDRRIEEGDEWYQEIRKAIETCDMAILLVSSDFIASRFIQDEELPKLLRRRISKGLRIVPIIVRPCMWKSEPILKEIQVLPYDGKPVIEFSKDDGERDKVWVNIVKKIEERAIVKSEMEKTKRIKYLNPF